MRHLKRRLQRAAAGDDLLQVNPLRRHRSGPRVGNADPHHGFRRFGQSAAYGRADICLAVLPVRYHENIVQVDGGDGFQRHRIHDAARVVNHVACDRIVLGPGRGLLECDAVNRLVCGIEHADGQQVLHARTQGLGDIEFEWRVAAFMAADPLAVHPYLRQIIDRLKTDQAASAAMRICGGFKLPPIPGDTVILGKNVLDHPRHLRRSRVGGRGVEPFLLAAFVFRIHGDPPVRAVQRDGLREHRCDSPEVFRPRLGGLQGDHRCFGDKRERNGLACYAPAIQRDLRTRRHGVSARRQGGCDDGFEAGSLRQCAGWNGDCAVVPPLECFDDHLDYRVVL